MPGPHDHENHFCGLRITYAGYKITFAGYKITYAGYQNHLCGLGEKAAYGYGLFWGLAPAGGPQWEPE